MKHDFDIYDEIVDTDGWGGISPQYFVDETKDLKQGDELVLHFNSPGGSVTAGIAMANRVKELSKSGVQTTAKIEGICASIATVIMCACDKVEMNKSAFVMIHNCWAVVQGDADELRKQADVMEKMNDAIMSFYRSKFDLTDDELKAYMDEETWFSGMEAKDFKFNCEVVEDENEVKLAAKFDLSKFHKIPEVLNMKNKEQQADDIKNEVEETTQETVVEDKADEVVAETTNEEPEVNDKASDDDDDSDEDEITPEDMEAEIEALKMRIEELELENDELKKKCEAQEGEETITKDEADKRVSGMQASMQKQVNALSTELNTFKSQLQAKEEELVSAKAEITSLNQKLDDTKAELSVMASTVEEKTKALEMLNSNVNAQAEEELPTMEEGLAKCASPSEKVAFLKSGKYVR